jgi:hypothetical protein
MTLPGDFTFLRDENERAMLEDAYKAISTTDSWEILAKDPGEGGFMFAPTEYLDRVNKALKYDGHSGASYGWTMRQMQYIAIHGWEVYCLLRG